VYNGETVDDVLEINYSIRFLTATARDLEDVSGTITLGPSDVHEVEVYHFRDLANEPTESYRLDVDYDFHGSDKWTSALGQIENLERPRFELSPSFLKEGETKEIWIDLEYPVDIESTVAIKSKDDTARVDWRDYNRFSVESFPFDPEDTRSRYSFDVSALSDAAVEGNESLFVVVEYSDSQPGSEDGEDNIVTDQIPLSIHDVGPISFHVTDSIGPVFVLSGDDDFDQVVDSVDLNGGPIRREGDRQFVPIQLRMNVNTSTISVHESKFTFDFNEAQLRETQQSISGETRGLLRVWTKPWHLPRTEDDLIHAGVEYNSTELNISPTRDLTLYVEAVTAAGFADQHLSSIDVHWDATYRTTGNNFIHSARNSRPVKVAARILLQEVADALVRIANSNQVRELIALYEQIYNPPQVVNTNLRDPLLDFMATRHNLKIIVTDQWFWQSRIVRPNSDNPDDKTWGVVIGKSDLESKGMVWGVEELRTLMLASIGVSYISPSEYYAYAARGNIDAEIRLFEKTRLDSLKASAKLWSDTIRFATETILDASEIAIGFVPGGGVFLASINIARGVTHIATKGGLSDEDISVGNGIQVVSDLVEFVPFLPAWMKKAGAGVVEQASSAVAMVFTKTASGFKRALPKDLFEEAVAVAGIPLHKLDFYNPSHWCFASDTKVHCCGGLKPIADVRIGDRVRTFDFDTKAWQCSSVQVVHKHQFSGCMFTIESSGEVIHVTVGHPFWVVRGTDLHSRPFPPQLTISNLEHAEQGRWVNVEDLQLGDEFLTIDGRESFVDSIQSSISENIEVFNLTVDGNHTFSVGQNGILVHNESWCDLAAKSYGITKEQLANKREEVAKLWKLVDAEGNALISRTHGHHLVHKVGHKGLGAAGNKANDHSRDMLTVFEIDVVVKKEHARAILDKGKKITQPDGSVLVDKKIHNLCIAPYEYVHGPEYAIKLNSIIKGKVLDVPGMTEARLNSILAGTKPSVEELAECREAIIQALQEAREKIERGDRL
jgi:hypothetical protein